MKEDKENARPKDKRGGPAPPAGLGSAMAGADAKAGGEPDRLERPKDKKETLSKVVIRRLPPSLTKEQLEEHLQPLPEHDYFEFFSNDSSLYPHMFSRAYINFKNQEDIVLFRDRFDGYVFIDHKGLEYPAIVEFAPFQKAAKKKSKKKDAKAGTIEEDPEYKKFLETYSADDEKLTSTPETLLEEIEARNKELIAKKTTPLLNFLKNKQVTVLSELEFISLCLLKKPEKDERDFEKKEKSKKLEKESLREEKAASTASSVPAKRSDGDAKEEKAKRYEDDCGKDFREREREYERDREYERIQRERDKLRRQEEERRRQKERFEKDKVFRRKEEDMKKERDSLREKGKRAELADYMGSVDKSDKVTKEEKKDDTAKRDRIRNKDRPAMQLYQPGARSRSRLSAYDEGPMKSPDQGAEKKHESETSNSKEEE
uniref:UPF3B regulator of nonsense mediated mRNA decay n=1 Tax=Salvator merianae TaxID=96440 RepID=A0A8D0KGS0_SALMN